MICIRNIIPKFNHLLGTRTLALGYILDVSLFGLYLPHFLYTPEEFPYQLLSELFGLIMIGSSELLYFMQY